MFIGIETPNEESLRETHKRQNLGIDLIAQIQRFVEEGIAVVGGMIIGFDSDGPGIFEHQYEFAMSSPIACFTLGALLAPDATPLRTRLQSENRLSNTGGVGAKMSPWETNIIPTQMSQQMLYDGLRWLANQLYAPTAFGDRLLFLLETFGQKSTVAPPQKQMERTVDLDVFKVVHKLPRLGEAEAEMFRRVTAAVAEKPAAQGVAMSMLFRYMQIRYMYERGHLWEPRLAEQVLPTLTSEDVTRTATIPLVASTG